MKKKMQTVFDYMRRYADDLSARVIEVYRPLHGPEDPESPLLARLKRTLLPAQKLVAMAMAKRLKTKPVALLVGECGPAKSGEVVAPPHNK